jgi:hypothetical protein
MKNLIVILLALLIFTSCKKNAQNKITISNNHEVDLLSHVVTISRNKLNDAPLDKMPIVLSQNDTLLSQIDDMNLDGEWDELSFLITLSANEQKEITINWIEEVNYPSFNPRTNIRFAKKLEDGSFEELDKEIRPVDHNKANPAVHYQMEGPAWENDVIGFRMYFDPRNGFDIFGKTTETMVLDKVGIEGNYHELQDWGMDILKVNNSLGAGALALHWQDTLYRLGKTGEATFQKITEGPVRSVFELNYKDWTIDNYNMSLRQIISIEAGNPFYKSEVWLEEHPTNAKLSTGIVNIHTDTAYQIVEKDYAVLATHDNQAFDKEKLGMALIAANKYLPEFLQAPNKGKGITQTYVLSMKLDDQPVVYYFMAGWENNDAHYSDNQYFLSEVARVVDQLGSEPSIIIN